MLIHSLLLICLYMPAMAQEWVNPSPDTLTSYVYAPGVLTSEILMGRYCPTFTASTGETISCSKGIEVIQNPATSTNLTEISLKQLNKKTIKEKKKARRASRTKKEIFINLLLTPFRALWYTASYCANKVLGFSIKPPAQGKATESLHMYWANPRKVNLAQEQDLALFHDAYIRHTDTLQQQDNRHTNVVLYGTSRGSATVFNFAALYKPQEVRAVICEGLFDSLEHVYTTTRSLRIRCMIRLLRKMGNVNEDGIFPITMVEHMPHDMPLLLITSHNDRVVPYECTMNIYQQLRATGHTNVHILVLDKASHVWYPHCSEKWLYQNVVHAFYKQYGLPHIPAYAQEGYEYFMTMTQPEIE